MCEVPKSECYYVDENENKLMYDSNHYSASEEKFFDNRIYELNWLKIN